MALARQHLAGVAGGEVALIFRATEIPAEGPVDVVVHLHGYSPTAAAISLLEMEAKSGLDFGNPDDPTNPYEMRDRPTIAILPRGKYTGDPTLPPGDSGRRRYGFPAFATAAGLQEVIEFALHQVAAQIGRESLERNRLILAAHSGGGAGVAAILAHTNPHEVQLFDATYRVSDSLNKWLAARIRTDVQRLRDLADADIYADMQEHGGAMRAVYIRGTGTQPAAVECHKVLASALNGSPDVASSLCPWYRVETVEPTVLVHDLVPSTFGWQLLCSAASDLTPPVERPRVPAIHCDPPAAPVEDTPAQSQGMPFHSTALDADASEVVDEYASAIEGYEQTLAAGFIPRLTTVVPSALDSTAYESSGRDGEYEDHRARLDDVVRQVNAWILDLEQSAVGQIRDDGKRTKFLETVDWSRQGFPGNKENAAKGLQEAHASALLTAMAALVPERRANGMIAYHNVDAVVVAVPGQKSKKLYPTACDAFVAMSDEAAADGVTLTIHDAWRSQKTQDAGKVSHTNPGAYAQGTSSHTYGLAIDLSLSADGLSIAETSTKSMPNMLNMYRTPAYKWMFVNAERSGWYPYTREPWHWEYNPPGFKEIFEGKTYGGRGRHELYASTRRAVDGQGELPDRSRSARLATPHRGW